jgi:predicted dehydrogenase
MVELKQLGVGIAGTGWVSTEHIRAFERNPFTHVTAICSRDKARAHAKAEGMGLEKCAAYDNYEAMLRDPNVQIIAICTPHHLHVEQGVMAAQAGKDILVEKPIAIDLAGLR